MAEPHLSPLALGEGEPMEGGGVEYLPLQGTALSPSVAALEVPCWRWQCHKMGGVLALNHCEEGCPLNTWLDFGVGKKTVSNSVA